MLAEHAVMMTKKMMMKTITHNNCSHSSHSHSEWMSAERTVTASVCLLALRVFPVVYSTGLDGDTLA